jgi:hypothetical protein
MLAYLVYEKQQKLKLMMKMQGLKDGPYWMISYAYFFVLSVVYMTSFVIFGYFIGNELPHFIHTILEITNLLMRLLLQKQIYAFQLDLVLCRPQFLQTQQLWHTICFLLCLHKFTDCFCVFCGIFLFICQDSYRSVT